MMLKTPHQLKNLYEIDDYLWIQETVKLLREKKFDDLDLENLIEELDDLGREKRHKVVSLLDLDLAPYSKLTLKLISKLIENVK